MEALPYKRFSARDIAVGFDPHRSLDFPAPRLDLFSDLLKQRRVVSADEIIMLCLRRPENKIRVAVQQVKLAAERPCAFADGFPDRPQPAGVDMGVSDGDGGQCAAFFRQAVIFEQFPPGGGGVCRICFVNIDRIGNGTDDPVGGVMLMIVRPGQRQ